MKNLLCGIGTSEIRESSIVITNYPFEPSIAYPEKLIGAAEINSICVDFGPAKIKIGDDIIFVTAESKEELKKFAERNKIKLSKPSWNWDWILEPYLDTELTEETKNNSTKRLSDNGIDPNEVAILRAEVGSQMYTYNFDTMLWDWASLGLCDVLSAMRVKYNKEKFREFYRKAMEIENRENRSLH